MRIRIKQQAGGKAVCKLNPQLLPFRAEGAASPSCISPKFACCVVAPFTNTLFSGHSFPIVPNSSPLSEDEQLSLSPSWLLFSQLGNHRSLSSGFSPNIIIPTALHSSLRSCLWRKDMAEGIPLQLSSKPVMETSVTLPQTVFCGCSEPPMTPRFFLSLFLGVTRHSSIFIYAAWL